MVREAIFSGPILGVACTPTARGRQTGDTTVRLDCLAIKRRVTTPLGATLEGARYFATIDLSTGDASYRGG